MCRRVATALRHFSCIAGLAIPLLVTSGAIAKEEDNATYLACAQREALLEMLVEAQGSGASEAVDKLSAGAVTLQQMSTACYNGRAKEALAFYDNLIAELTPAAYRRAAANIGNR